MPQRPGSPAISVLMPAHNAERYVRQSIQSVLAQSFEDFELLVVDDGSTDRTAAILDSIHDRRLRVLTNPVNLGIVGSLNRAMAAARGRIIARIDGDDFCQPTRFTRQHSFLEANPRTLIVGSEMSVLEGGRIRFSRQLADPDPQILRWMLHVSNPIGHSSMMFRAEAVDRLGVYLREEFKYAEDFDFSHRVLRHGDISVVPEYLVIYRVHDQNVTRTRRAEMTARTAGVLSGVYGALLGGERDAEAALMARHLIAGAALPDGAAARQLGGFLSDLVDGFCAAHALDAARRDTVRRHAGRLWWGTLRASLRAGHLGIPLRDHGAYRWAAESRPSAYQLTRPLLSGLAQARHRMMPAARRLSFAVPRPTMRVYDTDFQGIASCSDDPPCLYVVVDTEAEFDWGKDFDRSLTRVSAMAQQFRAQDIFDGYGVRPIYIMDYPVAAQPEGYEPLRAIFRRHACAIGAHLHPWVNPPFEEAVSDRNSFGSNLPADLEERKLRALVGMITQNFHCAPLFFKAGRYGIGRSTMDTLARLGFAVDFSILPLADLRDRGGPDFRRAEALPYRVGAGDILSVPMTRGQLGLLAPLPPWLLGAVRLRVATGLHLPGILARARIANTVTLTPEGVSAKEQIRLIRSMAARGCRMFTMHYHSPSLGMHTPYVRSEAELATFLQRITEVCRFFFDEFGGLPGNPADLLPDAQRQQIWPAAPADAAEPDAARGHDRNL